MKYLTILGSTGSIGNTTLSVVKQYPNEYNVHALVSGSNVIKMTKQCQYFQPNYACMTNIASAKILKENLTAIGLSTIVMSGNIAACELAALDNVDIVISAIVGTAGLSSTLSALQAGKRVLLANKESLVTCGQLFINTALCYGAQLIPIDSEHSAIFQSLPISFQEKLGYASLNEYGISNIVLTGSGGPFRQIDLDKLVFMTPEQACAHPNWSMGRKISVDSATMMNKGLEYIEARWLFNASPSQIEILLHPQSIIHGMVRYIDGSIIAQFGLPDMRIPIIYGLSYPYRAAANVPPLDFLCFNNLSFEELNIKRYPCLKLAIQASQSGQAATTTLNAANEIAVTSFLYKKLRFTDIATVIKIVLDMLDLYEPSNIEEVLFIDKWARRQAIRESIKLYHYL